MGEEGFTVTPWIVGLLIMTAKILKILGCPKSPELPVPQSSPMAMAKVPSELRSRVQLSQTPSLSRGDVPSKSFEFLAHQDLAKLPATSHLWTPFSIMGQ